MWCNATLRIADGMAPLTCAIVPAHPWVYGLGQSADSGGYLSPANAVNYLAKKLVTSGGNGSVIVLMVAANTHDDFMQELDKLAAVFPAAAFSQVSRMAQAAAELSKVKMQLPAKAANLLPAAVPLSVTTSRSAINAQRIAAAQLESATGISVNDLRQQLATFVLERASLLAQVSDSLTALKAASAPVQAFVHHGDLKTAAVELLKGIPQLTAVHTAAMMFTGNNLDSLEKMIHV
ncbi:hypothetical protein [Erwinia pyrifoliae]|uniref:Phage protein n=1 Tax=Erwinia pyrifoliae TaxID=79967 RepID=A0ABY5XCU3_ERWPY|nr:hypothetical protein [Erwinia pyrifoliae]MCT2387294.1 hypothetical protein [Erwinia pyrifoliae]MCU8587106.1 hypothetical protein [Erwinia pyrifoliae]UWS35233.1 hypothetical protein NYP84_08880 [Erwinia pyrifoliae]